MYTKNISKALLVVVLVAVVVALVGRQILDNDIRNLIPSVLNGVFLGNAVNVGQQEVSEEVLNDINRTILQYNEETAPEFIATVSPEKNVITNSTGLSGKIQISAKKDRVTPGFSAYSLNFDESNREFDLVQPASWFVHAYDDKTFFVAFPENDQLEIFGDRASIYITRSTMREGTIIESTQGFAERHLNYSPVSNLLAYNKFNAKSGYANMLATANWDIEVVDMIDEDVVYFQRDAWQPHWMPDGKNLIYLRNDGLYTYNFDNDQENQLVSVAEGSVIGTSMLDVSDDGTKLVWSSAKKGTLTYFEISIENGVVNVAPVYQLIKPETEFYWPRFSPKGHYVAVQAINTYDQTVNSRTNPRLEIRPLYSEEVVYEKSLQMFNFNALFTDDWVQ